MQILSSSRAKKTQKRTAKKKAALKKHNKQIESERYEMIRQLACRPQLKKKHLYFMMVDNAKMCRDDIDLLFDVMKENLGSDFDDLDEKPLALTIYEYEFGAETGFEHWFEAFASEMSERYDEDDANERIKNIVSIYTIILVGAKSTIDRYNKEKVELAA